MAGFTAKKRSRDDMPRLPKGRPSKKQRKQREYHSSSEDEAGLPDGQDFSAVNLLDSDAEDLDNMAVDDGEASGSDASSSDEDSSRETLKTRNKAKKPSKTQETKGAQRRKTKSGKADDRQNGSDDDNGNPHGDDDDDDDDDNDDEEEQEDDDEDLASIAGARGKRQSKRNDPTAFATSMSKILSTKLSTSRRADPVLARSAEAHDAARQAVDSALEAKAHRKMAEQRRMALERGRVRDVLVATNNDGSTIGGRPAAGAGDGQDDEDRARQLTTAEMLEAEKRLRKVAQRGVIKLFNAVRAAQVKAADAQRAVRAEGVVGMNRREEKVAEMSKKGFLDLIAAGGGGLKKGPLEEA